MADAIVSFEVRLCRFYVSAKSYAFILQKSQSRSLSLREGRRGESQFRKVKKRGGSYSCCASCNFVCEVQETSPLLAFERLDLTNSHSAPISLYSFLPALLSDFSNYVSSETVTKILKFEDTKLLTLLLAYGGPRVLCSWTRTSVLMITIFSVYGTETATSCVARVEFKMGRVWSLKLRW